MPIFFGIIDGGSAPNLSCVIDQDIDTAEVLDGRFDQGARRFFFRQIAGDREPVPPKSRDRFKRSLGRGRISMTSHIGAGFSESYGDRLAKTRRRAGHEGNLSL